MGGGDLYEFGAFTLEPAERRLSRSGNPVAITPKCFDLLVVLVENSGHLLSKGELLERVWPGQFVEESNLSFNISELRRLLGDGRTGVRYIETVRKNGFRFVARVHHHHHQLEADSAAADDAMPASPDEKDEMANSLVNAGEVSPATPELAVLVGRRRVTTWKFLAGFVAAGALAVSTYLLWVERNATSAAKAFKTIAVLPFKPLLSNARDEALELGMAETLIGRIGAADSVSVRPISAVRRYVDLEQNAIAAGRELGVEAVLDGHIQRAGGRVRVTARLVEVADGRQLWAGKFDEQFTDIFSVQDAISEQVARSLAVRLGDAERRVDHRGTRNPQAYELYLKGRFFLNKRTGVELEKAIDHFREALVLDSHYALAYSGLADAYPLLSAHGDVPPRESFPLAREAAEHALSLDDTLAEAHSSLAFVKEAFDWDFAQAEAEYRRAINLDPDYATARQRYGMFLMMMSRADEGLAELERARQLDPTSLIINADVGLANYFARRFDRCIEHLRNTVEMHPSSFRPHINLVGCYVQNGMFDNGIAEAQRALTLMVRAGPGASAIVSYSYAAAGRQREARAILNEWAAQPRRFAQPFSAAAAYAALGEREKALELLEVGYEERAYMLRISVDPALDSLRSDPRFQDLVRRVRPRQ